MDKEKKQKEKLFQNVDEILEGRKNNTISLVERKTWMFYDKYSTEKEREKKGNELEEREINAETEMDETSEGNKVGEVE